MSTLRDFLGLETTTSVSQLSVYNTGQGGSVNDGGRCCLYTVPNGITSATIELWGGGSGGAGACCCQSPAIQGTAGYYSTRKINLTAGTQLTICAGASTGCTSACRGEEGNPSYVRCAGTIAACASGGRPSTTQCQMWNFDSGHNCSVYVCSIGQCSDVCTGCGYYGMSNPASWCADTDNMASQGSPKYSTNMRLSGQRCVVEWTKSGCCYNKNAFPGGPGHSGAACGGGFCWGGWGASGLAIITFYG